MAALTRHSLLARGYFPKELPLPFHTDLFADQLEVNSVALPPEFAAPRATRLVRHELVRPGHLPRRLGIPNPLAAFELANELGQSWNELDRHNRKSRLSTSLPVPTDTRRAVRWSLSFRERELRRAESRASARYIVTADVSQFYPSIYTHVIPWALHGKEMAKARQNDQSLLGNRLDKALRYGQDRQTIGIAIGPDFSHIIAELILSAVDQRLQDAIPDLIGFRFVDDYEFNCSSEPEAERVLSQLQAALAEFELTLNSDKTRVSEAPLPHVPPWRADLTGFTLRNSLNGQHDDLLEYFDRAVRLAAEHEGAPVLRFAMGYLRYVSVHPRNWPLLQYLVLQAALAEPDCIRQVVGVIYTNLRRGFPLDRESVARTLSQLVVRRARQHGGSDVAWGIWGALVFGVELDDEAQREASLLDDPIVALVALDAKSRGLANALDTTLWADAMTSDDLYDRNWLLSYEASVKGWLPSAISNDHIAVSSTFTALRDWGVSFYDSTRFLDRPLRPAPEPEAPHTEELSELDSTLEETEEEWAEYPF